MLPKFVKIKKFFNYANWFQKTIKPYGNLSIWIDSHLQFVELAHLQKRHLVDKLAKIY